MRIPIAHCLAWPDRIDEPRAPARSRRGCQPDLRGTRSATASRRSRSPREALEAGGAAPTVLNAANEVAVAEFSPAASDLPEFRRSSRRRSMRALGRRAHRASRQASTKRLPSTIVARSLPRALAARNCRKGILRNAGFTTAIRRSRHGFFSEFRAMWGGGSTGYAPAVPVRADDRGLLPRARPFPGRALVRRPGAGVFDRLRPGDCRLQRPSRHALEDLRHSARRLCQILRRRERCQRAGPGSARRQ